LTNWALEQKKLNLQKQLSTELLSLDSSWLVLVFIKFGNGCFVMSEVDCWMKHQNSDFEFPVGIQEVYRQLKKAADQWEAKYPRQDFYYWAVGYKSPPRTIKPTSVRLK